LDMRWRFLLGRARRPREFDVEGAALQDDDGALDAGTRDAPLSRRETDHATAIRCGHTALPRCPTDCGSSYDAPLQPALRDYHDPLGGSCGEKHLDQVVHEEHRGDDEHAQQSRETEPRAPEAARCGAVGCPMRPEAPP